MVWSPLPFGKYIGKTLPQVIFSDPDWFFWAYEEKMFMGKYAKEAERFYQKATSIKVPQTGDTKLVVEYVIHQPTGKFGTMKTIPESRPEHKGSSPTVRSDVIDFSVPRKIAKYDKLGEENFIKAFKQIFYGDSKYKMTKRRCEEFFNNDDNLVPHKDTILTI